MSWYKSGFDSMKQEEDRLATLNGPNRLWMPAGAERDIIFLDDEPFAIYEHNPKINGSFKNWMTCVQGISDDVPCCEVLGANSRYYVGYFTVIDCSEFIDKKGNKHAYEVKLLGAKLKTMKKFRRKKEDRGSLVGCMYRAVREDAKSPVCGDEFEFKKEVDLAKVFEHAMYRGKKLSEIYTKAAETPEGIERLRKTFHINTDKDGKLIKSVTPFNYMEVLKPRSSKELMAFLRSSKIENPDDANAGEGNQVGADGDVPF